MSEEVKLEDIAEQPEEAVTEFAEAAIEEAPAEESSNSELSEAEAKAREQGWKPPEEFEEDGKEPISAEEFLRRGELFDKIKDLKNQSRRETQRLQQQVEELTGLVRTERKRGYEQAFKDLEGRRREAIETGDLEAFNQIDEEYIRVRDELTQERAMAEKQNAAEIPEEAVKFQEANADWFNSNTPENSAMVNQAVTIDQYLAEAKPYLTPAQRLQSVEKEIKNLYPHRFSNPKKKAPAKVEANASAGTVPTGAAKGKIKYSDLDDKQKAACERFMSLDPSLTAEDYLKSVEEGLRLRNQL